MRFQVVGPHFDAIIESYARRFNLVRSFGPPGETKRSRRFRRATRAIKNGNGGKGGADCLRELGRSV